MVETAARSNEPHRIAFYLYEAGGRFPRAFGTVGNDVPELRFLQEGLLAVSQSKIALAQAAAIVIASGLGILGVKPAKRCDNAHTLVRPGSKKQTRAGDAGRGSVRQKWQITRPPSQGWGVFL